MSLEMVARQRLEQRMHLSQQMLQNLELRQLPAMDLRDFIQKELDENPVLEALGNGEDPAEPAAEEDESPEDTRRDEQLARVEEEWLESERRTRRSESAEEALGRMEMLNNHAGPSESLKEHLAAQLLLLEIPAEMRALAAHVIEHVQDSGLLTASAEELVASLPEELRAGALEAVAEKIERAVAIVQSLEPRGVGARSIKECLLLQLVPEDPLSPLLRRFIELHLDDVGANRMPHIVRSVMADPGLMKELGREGELDPAVIVGDIKGLVAEIAKLSPRPGARYSPEQSPRVFPEVVVRLVEGKLEIVLEDGWLPTISVNRTYEEMTRARTLSAEERAQAEALARSDRYSKPDRAMLLRLASGKRVRPLDRSRSAELARRATVPAESRFLAGLSREPACTKEERDFLKQKVEAARKLISAIEQRRRTIYRIAEEVVRRQSTFFEEGLARLLPLKMQDIADALGIHISTVSRAASEKWMETPQGVFPFRFFFASAAPSGEDAAPEAATRLALLEKVRGILESEDKTHPHSDLDIVRILNEKYRVIAARRTVAKYREELRFPSMKLRKCY